ncbi:hypothetical protein BJAS_P3875 [Bathymodiolus japonicus methanotrophic gill symbiont]|uniref:hypothetical protein n=1 Tax=Bathymodiolus japonicus methanotrophic gill symbiont TaxID=113269 RepID=UPI001B49AE6C|nr:hypothetical protein [Bathymodiolus japonicus methanotrophic gill symbiont]GFO73203.1 hypothetical protein BJAS_P3875 [Bathymodiolus japonicus methanotrophic gill symbiont]
MSGCCYEIDEVLNEAIMTGKPVIIVEGINDISIYSNMGESCGVEVYAIEHIDGFSGGSDQVISAIQELNSLPNDTHTLSNHILGIIDKDVRDYRQELPGIEPLLVLKYYSIESHFVSDQIISCCLSNTIKANLDLVSDELCTQMMDEIEAKLSDLYYLSLEALRNSIVPGYSGTISYSSNFGYEIKPQTIEYLSDKKHDLDYFAADRGINHCIDTLKSISKGKWLIGIFSRELVNCIKGLQAKCEEGSIKTCRSCNSGDFDNCLYRLKDGFKGYKTIESLIQSYYQCDDVQYIKDRIADIR